MRPLLTIAALLCLSVSGWCVTQMLENPSMEVDADGDGVADGWVADIHTKDGAEGALAIDTDVFHSGTASQRIDHISKNNAWVRASQEPVQARPGTDYRISLWAKSNAAFSALIYEFGGPDGYRPHYIVSKTVAEDWTQYSTVISTSDAASHFKISVVANGPGSAWFDDVSLIEIGEKPHLKTTRFAGAPVIDGDLSDDAWTGAPVVGQFLELGADGSAAPVQTTVRAGFDDKALYISFECEEPNVGGLLGLTTEDAQNVWADDCVEVFLDVEGDRTGYLHLGVGAGGGKWQESVSSTKWYTNWWSFGGGQAPPPVWTAATSVSDGKWYAELALPFDQVGGPPHLGRVWGAQFCRTRRAGGGEENSTWSYTDGDKYAQPDRFGTLVFSVGPAGPPRQVALSQPDDGYTPVIIPQPVRAEWREGWFRPDASTIIRVSDGTQQPEAEFLQRDLKARFGMDIPIRLAAGEGASCIDISLAPDETVPQDEEAYRLEVSASGVRLMARSPRARLYGVGTLCQMLADAPAAAWRCCDITDFPSMRWRAWHTASAPAKDIADYKRLVDVLALLKFNTIVWEVNSQLQYETHPEVALDGAPTKAELKDLVDYAKSRHFEVIPQLASFAHFGYVLQHEQYRHLAEAQQTTYGNRSLFNYCPSNEETYQVVFDLMGEVAEVFEPRYFHIGHDEASFDDIGVCERCKGTEPWVLWARDINRLDAWIKERGMRTVMWGDQFLPSHNGLGQFNTANATDMVPKDILIFDWHYSFNHDYDATIGYFKEHGFEVVGCPWYEPMNVYRFASAALRNNILGFCGTTWYSVVASRRRMPHMPAAWVTGGENAWSTDSPAIDAIPYQPVVQFNRLWRIGNEALPRGFKLIDLAQFGNEATVDTEKRTGWMSEGPRYDMRALPGGVVRAGSIPFRIAEGAQSGDRACVVLADDTTPEAAYPKAVYELPVGFKTPALYFLHTCSVPRVRERQLYATGNPVVIGQYIINYEDGESDELPLRYQANICDWNSQRGPAQSEGLWQARTDGGALATLSAIQWRNPRPDVAVKSIDFVSSVTSVRPVLFAITAAE